MTRARRTVTGLGLVIGGALLGMLSLTALPWFRGDFGGLLNFGSRPSGLRETISFYSSAPDIYDAISFGVSPVYFRWLGVAVLLFGALAAAATVGFDATASRIASLVALAAALAGLVLTALAVRVIAIDGKRLERATGIASDPPGYWDFAGHASFGAWGTVVAFLAVAAGGVLAAGGRDSVRTLLADPEDEQSDDAPDDAPDDTGAVADPDAEAPPLTLEKRRPRGEDW